MIEISKSLEPASLTEHRSKVSEEFEPNYENFKDKDGLRKSIVAEQFGICSYCMGRIKKPEQGFMKIEHWKSQSSHPKHQLDYWNLLGACVGGEGTPYHSQHCDTRKGNKDIKFNPADTAHQIEARINYRSDGSVTSKDATFASQLDEILNLNYRYLKENRKSVLDAFQVLLGSQNMTLAKWEKLLSEWETPANGQLREYCGVVQYWIKKKIARDSV